MLKNLVSDEMKELIETVKTAAEEDIPLENPGEDTRYPHAFSELMPLEDALKGLHGTEDIKYLLEKESVKKAAHALKDLTSDDVKDLIDLVKTAAEEDIPLENPGEDTRYPGAFSELMPLMDALKGLHGTEDVRKVTERPAVKAAADAVKDLADEDIKGLIELVKTAAEEDIPLENPGEDTRYPGAFSELMPLMDALKGLHGTEDIRKVTERPAVKAAADAVKDLADEDIKGLIELVKTAAEEDIPLENPGEETRYPGVFSDLMPLADALKGLHASEDKKK